MDDISIDGWDGKIDLSRCLEDILLIGSRKDLDILRGGKLTPGGTRGSVNTTSIVRHCNKLLTRTPVDVNMAPKSSIVSQVTHLALSSGLVLLTLADL